jgi:hypothetical protein
MAFQCLILGLAVQKNYLENYFYTELRGEISIDARSLRSWIKYVFLQSPPSSKKLCYGLMLVQNSPRNITVQVNLGGCSTRAFECLSDGASSGVNYLLVSVRKRDACGDEWRQELSVILRDPLL